MTVRELRCASKKHGELDDEGNTLIKCNSRFCGAMPGTIVLHKFDRKGELVSTHQYKEIGARHGT